MKPKVYIEQASHKEKGKVYPGQQAQISVFDVGFQRSIGVFETMRTYQEKLFKLDEHLDRLANSVRQLELNNPWSKSELKERVVTALDKSNLEEATVRVILTGGEEQGLMEPNHPTLVIIVKDLHQLSGVGGRSKQVPWPFYGPKELALPNLFISRELRLLALRAEEFCLKLKLLIICWVLKL